jgi:predicted nucleic acid-binding protein
MKSLLLDANVLVYALVENCPENATARAKLDQLTAAGSGLVLCPQVVHESYSILTRHYGVKPAAATEWLEAVLSRETIEFLEPGLAETRLALELSARKNLKGRGFYDACLAALVLNFDLAGVFTDSVKDFKRLGVAVVPMRDG